MSRFDWSEMLVGTSIVVYVENPEKDFFQVNYVP